MIVEKDGSNNTFDVYEAHIRNYAKLSFEAIGTWLAHQTEVPDSVSKIEGMTEQVKLQERVARSIRQYRQLQGALAFKTIEASPVVVDGKIVELEEPSYNRARDIIENFMVSANAAITRFLSAKKMPVLRRVVRTPKRWSRIVELAAVSGDALPETPDVQALAAFLRKRKQEDPAHFPDLSLAVIKLLGKGEYVFNAPGQPVEGHFDLAMKEYAHTTAPNRRYPDLIIQRVLKSLFEGESVPYDAAELTAIATHCTAKEDDASKVQRRVNKSASGIILSSRINERFDAVVTGASDKGTWVRLIKPTIEGKLVQGFDGVDVGDRLTVTLVSVDVAKGFIDFAADKV
jgi:exoribonuclease-2